MVKEIKTNKLFNPHQVDHSATIKMLVTESSPRRTFLVMVLISSIIATLGLLNDSPAIVIGAMLVAPLLWPFLGISMGVLTLDWRMVKLSLFSIFASMVISIITAMFITLFYVPLGASREIIQQTNVAFMWPIAIAAGAAAAFAVSYPNIKQAVVGIAISVALLPPLVTIGIGLGGTDWELMQKAFSLFIINLIGIFVITYIIFWLLGFKKYRKIIATEVKKEERILKS